MAKQQPLWDEGIAWNNLDSKFTLQSNLAINDSQSVRIWNENWKKYDQSDQLRLKTTITYLGQEIFW
jgi:hypothetical protein